MIRSTTKKAYPISQFVNNMGYPFEVACDPAIAAIDLRLKQNALEKEASFVEEQVALQAA